MKKQCFYSFNAKTSEVNMSYRKVVQTCKTTTKELQRHKMTTNRCKTMFMLYFLSFVVILYLGHFKMSCGCFACLNADPSSVYEAEKTWSIQRLTQKPFESILILWPTLTKSVSVYAETAVNEERVIWCCCHGEHGAAQRWAGWGEVTSGGEQKRSVHQFKVVFAIIKGYDYSTCERLMTFYNWVQVQVSRSKQNMSNASVSCKHKRVCNLTVYSS